tara:strand:+ start:8189 stop:8407 length:219 start_codon:yes stop_codon:yes gene_type:complete
MTKDIEKLNDVIKQLKKENELLIQRIKSCDLLIEDVICTLNEWFDDDDDKGDIYIGAIKELDYNKKTLTKIK